MQKQQRGRSPSVTQRSESSGADGARDLTSSAGHRSAHRLGPRRAGSAGHERRARDGGAFAGIRAAGQLQPTAALQQQNEELQQMVEVRLAVTWRWFVLACASEQRRRVVCNALFAH